MGVEQCCGAEDVKGMPKNIMPKERIDRTKAFMSRLTELQQGIDHLNDMDLFVKDAIECLEMNFGQIIERMERLELSTRPSQKDDDDKQRIIEAEPFERDFEFKKNGKGEDLMEMFRTTNYFLAEVQDGQTQQANCYDYMKLALFFALYMDTETIEERTEFLFLMMADEQKGRALVEDNESDKISPENGFAKRVGIILLTLAAKFPVEQVKDVSALFLFRSIVF